MRGRGREREKERERERGRERGGEKERERVNCLYYRNFKFHDVHVQGSRLIAEACKAAEVKRLIHFSALGASKDSPSKFLQSKVTRNHN